MMSLVSAASQMSLDPPAEGDTHLCSGLGRSESAMAIDTHEDLLPPATPHHATTDTPPVARLPIARLPLTAVIPPALQPDPLDDYDCLWQHGVVHTPPLRRSPWPAGIYARDMAMAFIIIGDPAAHDATIAQRFEATFPGRQYKYATFQAQRAAWVDSSDEERVHLMQQPRTAQGLWTASRRLLSGWQKRKAHRRHSAEEDEM